jgi:hypothetical protein
MTKYVYSGDEELVFPTVGKLVRKGDEFDGPEGLVYEGLSVVDGKKAKIVDTSSTDSVSIEE